MRFGIHVSIGGGLAPAARRAAAMGCQTMQIFSSNPRSWSVAPIDPAAAAEFRAATKDNDIWPIYLHTPYLVNLAAPDDEIRHKSQNSVLAALRRAGMLDARYVVTHIGSYKDTSLESGIDRVVESLDVILGSLDGEVTLLLENTTGSGRGIGGSFAEFHAILAALPEHELRLGVCLDTAHLWGAGFDISSAEGVDGTLNAFAGEIGLPRLHLIHANDSSMKLASHRDVHQPPGQGLIGLDAFAALINEPRLQKIPFILETPTEGIEAVANELSLMRSLSSDLFQ